MEKLLTRISFDEVCPSCHGTGLYQGMSERDGFAVVCYKCKGTGCHHFVHEYEPFTERQPKDGVRTVLQCNPGIMVGGEVDCFGGISYAEWLQGKPFVIGMEMRQFTCPAWWYQLADYSKKPDWRECTYGMFSGCRNFKNKHLCWERFDKEATGQ